MKVLTIAIILCLVTVEAMASIHVTWGYAPPTEPAVTGFKLYQSGQLTHTWVGADLSEGDADVTPEIGDAFTLTATFADGSESPPSAPYIWTGNTIIVSFRGFLWFFKPSHKRVRIGATGLKGARVR